MPREGVLEVRADHRADLARLGVRSLALFGSVARDEARPGRDIDLLVDFAGAATFDRYVELSFLLEDLLGRMVDLVIQRSLHPALRPSVEKDALYVPGRPAVPR
jgi:predicted nucleotidyltransferase